MRNETIRHAIHSANRPPNPHLSIDFNVPRATVISNLRFAGDPHGVASGGDDLTD